jgi:hypothetical protein
MTWHLRPVRISWTERPDFPRVTWNGAGDPITTDTRVAVIGLRDCLAPRPCVQTLDLKPIPPYELKLQRFARREILSARNDLIRTKPYWRTFEGGRLLVTLARRRWLQNSVRESISNQFPCNNLQQSANLSMARPK